MTLEIPCCKNCPNYQYRVVETEGEYCLVADEFIDNATDTLEKVGCLSHPGARAYLNKDMISDQRIASAISELEQQITTEGEEIPGHGNAAIKYAILILRGGKK
jgi:hypothetical protein